ncbi:hypothetical protein Leryth_019904 [Lithospermum erythrorhizon]|nr:hypothetical protein Leryth_019904 [Lithospermum erythrorhizon]
MLNLASLGRVLRPIIGDSSGMSSATVLGSLTKHMALVIRRLMSALYALSLRVIAPRSKGSLGYPNCLKLPVACFALPLF